MAAPVIHELWFGCHRMAPSRKRDLLEAYLDALSALPILSYDTRAARRHAEERARLESIGKVPSFVDGQRLPPPADRTPGSRSGAVWTNRRRSAEAESEPRVRRGGCRKAAKAQFTSESPLRTIAAPPQ